MTHKPTRGTPRDPSRRRLLKAGMSDAAALGAVPGAAGGARCRADHGLVDVEIEFLTNWMFARGDGRREAEQPVSEMARIMRPRHLKCGNFAQPEPVEDVKAGFRA